MSSEPFATTSENSFRISNKRGRKPTVFTKVLSLFIAKNQKGPPRKEFIRCCILRLFRKTLNSLEKNRKNLKFHPILIDITRLFNNNIDLIKSYTAKPNLPKMDHSSNKKFNTYNNNYCQNFLSCEIMQQIYRLFIDYLFETLSIRELGKKIGAFCCKDQCDQGNACQVKWEMLKELLICPFV